MEQRTAIAIIGLGKIARDAHMPALRADPRFDLRATVDPGGGRLEGVPGFPDLAALLARGPAVQAVAICTPPVVRARIARDALAAGLDVLLEKPPAATLSEIDTLSRAADAGGRVLFAAWHSRFATMIARARDWAATRTIAHGAMRWREDAHKWHPGQTWLWEPGGLGVFDPAINGFSILTSILPAPVEVRAAALDVPLGAHTPVAATLMLASGTAEIACDLSFLETKGECWEIDLEATDGGRLTLAAGGHRLRIDGQPVSGAENAEYPSVYARFADLIAARRSDADVTPLRIVADCYLIGRSRVVEAFAP